MVPKCTLSIQYKCDGAHGPVHSYSALCHNKEPKCKRCAKIKELEAEFERKQVEMLKQQELFEAGIENEQKKLELQRRELELQKVNFIKKKEAEKENKVAKINNKKLAKEQELREKLLESDLLAEEEKAQKVAEVALERAELEFQRLCRVQEREARVETERIEKESADGVVKLRQDNAAQTLRTAQNLQEREDELSLAKARNNEERQRIAHEQETIRNNAAEVYQQQLDEAKREEERMQHEAREQQLAFNAKEKEALSALRLRLDRTCQLAAVQRRDAGARLEAVDDPEVQGQLAEQLHTCCIMVSKGVL